MERNAPARPEQQHAHNLALVSRLIFTHGPVSRAELAKHSGLTKTTVTQLTRELLDAGLIRELGLSRSNGPGRPATHLVVNSSGPVGIGVQIEADHVAGCLFDLTGRLRDRALRRGDDLRGDPVLAAKAAEPVLRRLLATADARDTVVAGVAVGVPGRVDDSGRVHSVELGWADVELSRLLTHRLEVLSGGLIPVTTYNGFQLAALAERWFGAVETDGRPLVVVAGELTVGVGVVGLGDVASWSTGPAGELGHVRVRRGGDRCVCGARGCLDTVAGPRTLLRASGPDTPVVSRLSGGDGRMRALARSRDPESVRVLRRAAAALADSLAGFVAALGPATVVLGGHFAPLGPAFAQRVAGELHNRCGRTEVTVTASHLDGDAVARAAAVTVTRRLVDDPTRWMAS